MRFFSLRNPEGRRGQGVERVAEGEVRDRREGAEDRFQVKVFVDCTLGAGGHSELMLRDHPELQTLVGIDMDPDALALAQARLEPLASRTGVELRLVQGNFADVERVVDGLGLVGTVDAMFFDLGVSSMQLDRPERGFSFLRDGPLDMRLGPGAVASAAEVVNGWSEVDLGRVLREYGEERQWRALAGQIVVARQQGPITTTHGLLAAWGMRPEKNFRGIHPATRAFQAIRIACNDELGVIRRGIPGGLRSLSKGGRLGAISFHSLEDRIVKGILKSATVKERHKDRYGSSKGMAHLDEETRTSVARFMAEAGPHPALGDDGEVLYTRETLGLPAGAVDLRALTKRPIIASESEVANNPRSRSAKLRFAERL